MDFPWHKPSSYGGTHDLGNLPYMFWFWSIQKGLTNDGFCITFDIHRRPLELTFSWLVGPLVASGIEWLIYGSASCRGASVHPCPLFHQKTHKFPGSCRKLHSKIIQTSPSVGSLLANLVGTTGAVWKLKGTTQIPFIVDHHVPFYLMAIWNILLSSEKSKWTKMEKKTVR